MIFGKQPGVLAHAAALVVVVVAAAAAAVVARDHALPLRLEKRLYSESAWWMYRPTLGQGCCEVSTCLATGLGIRIDGFRFEE
jgi:hypothetical protein